MEDGGSVLVLMNVGRVPSLELKSWTAEVCDEEARILPICEETLVLTFFLDCGQSANYLSSICFSDS